MTECSSFGGNYQCRSQSRKMSIGVLVDSLTGMDMEITREAAKQLAENITSMKKNLGVDCEGHDPFSLNVVADAHKGTAPSVPSKSFNPKLPSSMPVHDAELTPSFPAATKSHSRSKDAEVVAHSVRQAKQKYLSKAASGATNASTEHGFFQETKLAEDKNREAETGGIETLRMKLWEAIENGSSMNFHHSHPQSENIGCKDLDPDLNGDKNNTLAEKIVPQSDMIEGDPEQKNHIFRTLTSSLLQKAAKQKQLTKEKSIFSVASHCSKRLRSHNALNSVFSNPNSKRTKSEAEKIQKSMLQSIEVEKGNSSGERRKDATVGKKSDTKKRIFSESPDNVITEWPSGVEHTTVAETPNLEHQPEDTEYSPLSSKSDHAQDPESHIFEINSPAEGSAGCSPMSSQIKDRDMSNSEKIINKKSSLSFKNFLNSKSAASTSNVKGKTSDVSEEVRGYPFKKPSIFMEKNRISETSSDDTDSDNSVDDSHIEDFQKAEPLFPDIDISKSFYFSSIRRPSNQKGIDATECSPISNLFTGIEKNSKLQTSLEQDQEEGFTSAVAVFTVALQHFKANIKTMISKRSLKILMEAAEEISLYFQNTESQIKADVEKLIDNSKSKTKRLDARFQEQQGQFLAICKKFKSEVDQLLQNYRSVMEDVEKLGTEMEGNVERKRAAHKKLLSQAEQDIYVQINNAESKILAVQELAGDKMLQLKLAIAKCIK